MPLVVAVRVAEPAAMAVAMPPVLRVAMLEAEEVQLTVAVRFLLAPSE
jgi:hypothetical protein